MFFFKTGSKNVSRNGKKAEWWNVSKNNETLGNTHYRLNINTFSLCSSYLSTVLFPLYGLCPLHNHLSLLVSGHLSSPMALYLLYSPLSLRRPSVTSTALCLIYSPLSPLLRPSVPSTALCPFYNPLSPLWLSVPSTARCPLCCPLSNYGPLSPQHPLSPLWPSVHSTALGPLYGPMSPLEPLPLVRSSAPCTAPPLRPSVPSTVLCPLYGSLPPLRPSASSIALFPLYARLRLHRFPPV